MWIKQSRRVLGSTAYFVTCQSGLGWVCDFNTFSHFLEASLRVTFTFHVVKVMKQQSDIQRMVILNSVDTNGRLFKSFSYYVTDGNLLYNESDSSRKTFLDIPNLVLGLKSWLSKGELTHWPLLLLRMFFTRELNLRVQFDYINYTYKYFLVFSPCNLLKCIINDRKGR